MDVFTASLRSACSLRRGHFVNNLKPFRGLFIR
ncbi:gluconate 5-dehydrogenase [Yersinia similis]